MLRKKLKFWVPVLRFPCNHSAVGNEKSEALETHDAPKRGWGNNRHNPLGLRSGNLEAKSASWVMGLLFPLFAHVLIETLGRLRVLGETKSSKIHHFLPFLFSRKWVIYRLCTTFFTRRTQDKSDTSKTEKAEQIPPVGVVSWSCHWNPNPQGAYRADN